MPVHVHGCPCDLDEVMAIARKHDLAVVEDAAQAHGATYKGRPVGAIGAAGGFSLQSSKNLPGGEGGVFVTNSDELADVARSLRTFGQDVLASDAGAYDPGHPLDGHRALASVRIGSMYRGNELMAAFVRAQLARLPALTRRCQENAERLRCGLAELPGVHVPRVPADRTSVHHKLRVHLDPARAGLSCSPRALRDATSKALAAEGLEVVLWQTEPLPAQPLFRGNGYGKGFPWAVRGRRAGARRLRPSALPCHPAPPRRIRSCSSRNPAPSSRRTPRSSIATSKPSPRSGPVAAASSAAAEVGRARRWLPILRVALLLAGLAAMVLLVRRVGPATVLAALVAAGPYVPLLITLEAAWMGMDVFVLRALLGARASEVPWSVYARSAVSIYPVTILFPAGRASAEATRAALLSPYLGAPTTALAAILIQGAGLMGNALVSLVALAGDRPPRWASRTASPSSSRVSTLAMAILGLLILFGARHPRALALLRRFMPAAAASHFAAEPTSRPIVAMGLSFLGRAVQAAALRRRAPRDHGRALAPPRDRRAEHRHRGLHGRRRRPAASGRPRGGVHRISPAPSGSAIDPSARSPWCS